MVFLGCRRPLRHHILLHASLSHRAQRYGNPIFSFVNTATMSTAPTPCAKNPRSLPNGAAPQGSASLTHPRVPLHTRRTTANKRRVLWQPTSARSLYSCAWRRHDPHHPCKLVHHSGSPVTHAKLVGKLGIRK